MELETFTIFLIICFICTVCIFIISTSNLQYHNTEKDLVLLDYLKTSWEKGPIIDIQLSKFICPIDYQAVRLYLTNEVKNTTDYSKLNYSGFLIHDTYDSYTYRNSLICVKRAKKNYFEYLPSTFNSSGDFDKFKNKPYYNEVMVSNVYVIDYNEPTPKDYYRREFLDNKKSLIFSLGSERAIIDFKIQQGEICSNPLELSINSSLKKYNNYKKINGCKTLIGGTNKNPHFTWIDNDSLQNTFGNLFYPEDYNDINEDEENINLYYQQYPGLNYTCYSSLPIFNKKSGYLEVTYTLPLIYAKTNSILSYIIMFTVIFSIILTFLIEIFSNNKDCFITIAISFVVILSIVSIIITWIFFSFFTSNHYTQYLSSYSFLPKYGKKTLNKDFINYCFDYFSSEYLIFLKDQFNSSYITALISSILITLIACTTIVLPIILPFIQEMYNL